MSKNYQKMYCFYCKEEQDFIIDRKASINAGVESDEWSSSHWKPQNDLGIEYYLRKKVCTKCNSITETAEIPLAVLDSLTQLMVSSDRKVSSVKHDVKFYGGSS